MRSIALFIFAILACALHVANATQVPKPGREDPRIRYVVYNRDDVVEVPVRRGTVTRIVLAPNEKIAPDGAAIGFPADCTKPDLEWCIRADAGSNQVLVKPKDGASHNNLELRTDLRDYSFAFRVLPNAAARDALAPHDQSASGPAYRVVFRYPASAPASITAGDAITKTADHDSLLQERLAQAKPVPRNWRYAMQSLKGSDDIRPALVFDDGRFTYFRFPENREIPTIYAVTGKGEEARVNFHMDSGDATLAVVERVARQFVLRLGGAAVGVWNEGFDPDGVASKEGTTINGVSRILREGK